MLLVGSDDVVFFVGGVRWVACQTRRHNVEKILLNGRALKGLKILREVGVALDLGVGIGILWLHSLQLDDEGQTECTNSRGLAVKRTDPKHVVICNQPGELVARHQPIKAYLVVLEASMRLTSSNWA